jgi:hypothetical protein
LLSGFCNRLRGTVKARYIDGYRIEAVFSNGIKKMIDFAPVIQRAKGIVKKLEDVEFFKKFTLDPFTIDWNNEIGFDPQDLYEMGTTIGYDNSIVVDNKQVVAEP